LQTVLQDLVGPVVVESTIIILVHRDQVLLGKALQAGQVV
jgi:hypothetical protein